MNTRSFLMMILGSIISPHLTMAQSSCTTVPQNIEDAPVSVCQSQSHLQFKVGDETIESTIQDFEDRIDKVIFGWLQKNRIKFNQSDSRQIGIWLTYPESNPSMVQGRIQIEVHGNRVLLSFDPRSISFNPDSTLATILGSSSYPEDYGWSPETVLLRTEDSDMDSLKSLCSLAGIYDLTSLSAQWFVGSTRLFDEKAAALRLMKLDPLATRIQSVQLNHKMEWIGFRGFVYQFKR
ncbi:MAG: hypothetical protein NT027_01005 [Proteobacteria bacterium]|nr:hypothetical protein [Pseudomonadota bacterium]